MERVKDRIVFLDVAKGLCIFLVVMIHTGVPEPIPHLYVSKVVLFFLLSGYFYHDDMSWADFLRKKVRTLLIPFLFFYVVSYALYYLMVFVKPSLATLTEAKGILDCFTQKNYFNGPLWFLLSLFEVQVLMFLIRKATRREVWRWVAYALTLWGGYCLSTENVDLPLNLDTAFTFVIFFATGHKLREIGLLERANAVGCLALALLGYSLFCVFPVECYASVNRYVCDNVVELFCMLTVLSLSIVFFCKALAMRCDKGMRVFSYAGRHTMWILCSHHLIYRPIKMICSHALVGHSTIAAIVVFLITIMICLFSASYVERRVPWALGK